MNFDAVLAANFNCFYQIMRFYPNFGSQTFCFWLNSLLPNFLLLKDSITSTIKDIYKSAGDRAKMLLPRERSHFHTQYKSSH